MKNNADNLMCEYSESVVAYLYDELPVRETSIFEAHLEHCTMCTDEFAAIADTRYSVYEWHKEEFVPLATPRFVVPSEPVKVSVWEQLAGLLGPRPSIAFAGGFAVLLVAVAIGFVALRQPEVDVAANVQVPAPVSAATTAPTALPPIVEPVPAVQVPDVRPESVKATAVRTSRPFAKHTAIKRPSVRDVDTIRTDSPTQARKAPALSNDIDVEDESLRLTDLFDEVGG